MTERNTIILHLSLIDGAGPSVLQIICANKPITMAWAGLYQCRVSDFVCVFQVPPTIAQKIVTGLRDDALLAQELVRIEQNGINWCTWFDDEYPSLLQEIHAPPAVLYWRGDLAVKKGIAFVGSRKANAYGNNVITTLVPPLVARNWTIISGGALGADSMAHRAALAVGGNTIAIFGSGLLKSYPRQNGKLFEDIIASGGAVVSPFHLLMEAKPGNFPARNRIVSGMSKGCVVIQAAAKSGTSITAQYALDQGRDVFAVPGPINDHLSAGCHALIKQGAQLVHTADDICSAFGEVIKKEEKKEKEKNAVIPLHVEASEKEIDSIPLLLIRACMQPRSADELAYELELPLEQIQEQLFELQLNNMINQDFTGLWVAQ